MRKITTRGLIPLLLLALGGGAAAQQGSDVTALQPGDVVSIEIWREPDLSGSFVVNEAGVVVLPLLGARRVADVPMAGLRDSLLQDYQGFLRNPSITVTLRRRVHVLGEVNQPGLYEVDPTFTLEAVVALAGGATPGGDLNRIRVVRGGTVMQERVASGRELSAIDIRSGDQILVDRRSWFERNSTFLISVGLSLPSVVAGILALVNR